MASHPRQDSQLSAAFSFPASSGLERFDRLHRRLIGWKA